MLLQMIKLKPSSKLDKLLKIKELDMSRNIRLSVRLNSFYLRTVD